MTIFTLIIITLCKATPREIEKKCKKSAMFSNLPVFKVTIEANKKIVNSLDVTFDLSNGSRT